jgi:hypothetical protein
MGAAGDEREVAVLLMGRGGDRESFTTSLASNITDHKYENGRRYHGFREGSKCTWPLNRENKLGGKTSWR